MLKEAYTGLEDRIRENAGRFTIGAILAGHTVGGALAAGIDYAVTGTADLGVAAMVGAPAAMSEMVGLAFLTCGVIGVGELIYYFKDEIKEHYKPTQIEA